MDKIDITTDQLLHVASEMHSLCDCMSSIASTMKQRAGNMKDWTDARAEQFREQANTTALQLELHIDNFIKMSAFLKKYADMQSEAEREQNQRMMNLHN